MIERFSKRMLFHPVIQTALDEGGYIAGGAARALYLRKNIRDYLQVDGQHEKELVTAVGNMTFSFPHRTRPAGDIDIFFPTAEKYSAAHHRLTNMLGEKGLATALSVTFHVHLVEDKRALQNPAHKYTHSTPIQLVKCVHGKPEDMISNFDIVNCSVAITRDGFVVDDMVKRLEDRSALKIRRADSTQLFKRVMKYMLHRDIAHVDDTTRDMISEWLLRYVSGEFAGPTAQLSAKPSETWLETALKMGVLNRDHLVYLVGRPEFNGKITEVDESMMSGYRVIGARNIINDLIGKSSQ
jgi:hypothetical protein